MGSELVQPLLPIVGSGWIFFGVGLKIILEPRMAIEKGFAILDNFINAYVKFYLVALPIKTHWLSKFCCSFISVCISKLYNYSNWASWLKRERLKMGEVINNLLLGALL